MLIQRKKGIARKGALFHRRKEGGKKQRAVREKWEKSVEKSGERKYLLEGRIEKEYGENLKERCVQRQSLAKISPGKRGEE